MRDKPDKKLDRIDAINAYDPALAKKVRKLNEIKDRVIIEAAFTVKE